MGSTPLAVVTDTNTPAASAALRFLDEAGVGVLDDDDGAAASTGPRVLVAGSVSPVDAATLRRFPGLELVVRTGAGYEKIDVTGLRAHGVEVARAAGRNIESVAEFVFAGLLAMIRRVRESDAAVRSGDFAFRDRVVAGELRGRTLGILGFGPIGARVAEIGAGGFGMPVLAHHPWRTRPLPAGMTAVDDLDEFLTRSDVVSIHCRLSPESRGMIGAAQLGLLGAGGHLVNTARGEIVDPAALAHALTAGIIAGAVLDVFPTEPLDPGSPLVAAPNLLLSPHLAGHTTEGVAGNGAWAAVVATDYLHHGRRPPEWSLCP